VDRMCRLLVVVIAASALPLCSGSIHASAGVVSACAPAQATLSATANRSNYVRGTSVHISVVLHNHARVACAFVTGPTSPNFEVTNTTGVTVWGSCWFSGRSAPCAEYLVQRSLAPGATYRDKLTWNQRTGRPDLLVSLGRYRFTVTLSGLALRATTVFSVARP
jgi:hypothetical protein